MTSIPLHGINHDDIFEKMTSFRHQDADHLNGRTWSLVYHHSKAHDEFIKKAHRLFFSENGLNPMAFQSLKRFEHEVVQMTSSLLHGDKNTVGVMTSGGTESCLLPVLAYRERAKKKNKWGRFAPQMVAPESIHVAWDKAAKYFNIKMVKIPVTQKFTMNLDVLKEKINRHTIMIIASAPCYPHGVIDPIAEISQIAKTKKIPFHVDACLGGFFLPFLEKTGQRLPLFDFRSPGVTSMSADAHKYGFGAKGASVLLYKNMAYLKHQFFIHQDWPGGVFASPALLGTRPGGPIAAAWAAMNAMGMDGYNNMVVEVMETTRTLIKGIQQIKGLKILGAPEMSVFAFNAHDPKVNIFAVGDIMAEKGWHIDRLQRPEALHAMVTPAHAKVADQYLIDLSDAVEVVRKNPNLASSGNAAMYGMIAKAPFRGLIKKEVMKMMEKMYGPKGEMPLDNPENKSFALNLGARLLRFFK